MARNVTVTVYVELPCEDADIGCVLEKILNSDDSIVGAVVRRPAEPCK